MDKKKATRRVSAKAPSREGKVAIMGYFSPELSTRMHMLRASERTSIQALLGEAIDLLLVDRGQNPAGER